MLSYTGHPLVDVGIATIAAFVKKRDPASLTETDLDKVADFMARQYVVDPLKTFLTVAFPNSGFTQPAFNKKPEKRDEYAKRVLYGYKADTPKLKESCVFTGKPAVGVAFSDKLPPGRAFRQHIPLITGENVINFFPWGNAGLLVSGEALLAIQAFPLGCAKCNGRLLAVHSDNPDLTYEFAAKFLEHNRKAITLAQQGGSKKLPEAGASARTFFIETLLDIEQSRQDESIERRPSSVTAYHLSNLGSTPSLDIYHLPLEITDFLSQVVSPDYKTEWNALVQRAWWVSIPKNKKKKEIQEDTQHQRNVLYEDLLQLPENARQFLRCYFLRIPVRTRFEGDPRRTYSLRDEANLVSWKLTELFLRRIMNMEKDRIDQIRTLADRLADYVFEENDKKFFAALFEPRYDYFRTNLIRATLACVQKGKSPLIKFDPYIEIFENGDEIARSDWRLARDLVLIRMVEQLYQKGWLGSQPEAVPEISEELETTP
ncbi:MAG: type I-B CRISPR-associated protein Cas8b1/Cst1 [Methanothrix sp.]|jgi:CRISPR-associated protein Cst1|nr:type I-B CRISPR-associated protein Cas8b1/Cst1 [Methanothrix sp.]